MTWLRFWVKGQSSRSHHRGGGAQHSTVAQHSTLPSSATFSSYKCFILHEATAWVSKQRQDYTKRHTAAVLVGVRHYQCPKVSRLQTFRRLSDFFCRHCLAFLCTGCFLFGLINIYYWSSGAPCRLRSPRSRGRYTGTEKRLSCLTKTLAIELA